MMLKFYLMILLVPSTILLSYSQNSFSQPVFSTFVANPSNTLLGSQSFYAFHITLKKPNGIQFIDTIKIRFPDTDYEILDARIVQTSGIGIANLIKTQTSLENSLIFKLSKPGPVNNATILIDGIKNPNSLTKNEFVLESSLAGQNVFGPLKSVVVLEPKLHVEKRIISAEEDLQTVDANVTVQCNSDESVSGGGYEQEFDVRQRGQLPPGPLSGWINLVPKEPEIHVEKNGPGSSNDWIVTVHTHEPLPSSELFSRLFEVKSSIIVHAVCIKLAP